MTNTGDFRRYSYGSDAAYAVQAFNYQRSSAAPAYIPKPEKEFKVRQRGQRKSKAQLVHEQKLSLKKALSITTVAALCLSMLFAVLLYQCKKQMNLPLRFQGLKKIILPLKVKTHV